MARRNDSRRQRRSERANPRTWVSGPMAVEPKNTARNPIVTAAARRTASRVLPDILFSDVNRISTRRLRETPVPASEVPIERSKLVEPLPMPTARNDAPLASAPKCKKRPSRRDKKGKGTGRDYVRWC